MSIAHLAPLSPFLSSIHPLPPASFPSLVNIYGSYRIRPHFAFSIAPFFLLARSSLFPIDEKPPSSRWAGRRMAGAAPLQDIFIPFSPSFPEESAFLRFSKDPPYFLRAEDLALSYSGPFPLENPFNTPPPLPSSCSMDFAFPSPSFFLPFWRRLLLDRIILRITLFSYERNSTLSFSCLHR